MISESEPCNVWIFSLYTWGVKHWRLYDVLWNLQELAVYQHTVILLSILLKFYVTKKGRKANAFWRSMCPILWVDRYGSLTCHFESKTKDARLTCKSIFNIKVLTIFILCCCELLSFTLYLFIHCSNLLHKRLFRNMV